MYDNIGSKIKTLAKVLCWIGIIGYIVLGIVLIFTSGFLIGVLVGVVGALLSWIGPFILYGLGQLIENSDTIVFQNKRLLDLIGTNVEYREQNKTERVPTVTKPTHTWRCASCGSMISEYPCPHCNYGAALENSELNGEESDTIVCSNCNTKNLRSNGFCWSCGKKLQ